jgi:tellurite resistance protein TehA-like permease
MGPAADRARVTRVAGSARVLRGVHPGWFAMVMATGIVSVALLQAGSPPLSVALLWLAAPAFAVLTVLSAWRAAAFGPPVRDELGRPDQVFSYFAFAAAASVLGSRLADYGHRDAAASAVAVLALAAALAWILLTVLVLVILAVRPGLRQAITEVNGTWQLWVVGTQSVAIAATSAYAEGFLPARPGAVTAIVAWSAGAVLYPAVTILVMARLLGAGPAQEPFAPYWVTMGAASITVLAATQILPVAAAAGLAWAKPVLIGAALAFWSVAAALIPVLTVIGGRRRLRRRGRMRFRRELWMIVFPAGMYATASMRLGAAAGLPPVRDIGLVAVWPAAAAWALVFAGMILAPFSPPRAPRRSPWRWRRREAR